MDANLRRAIGILLILVPTTLFGSIGYVAANQDFRRLLTCFTFCMLGLGLRALFYGEAKSENIISYGYYAVALIAITSSIFLGFYGTLKDLPGAFFYFLAFTLFTSMGFIVRSILNGLIG